MNICVPLVIGLLIYVTKTERTFISDFFGITKSVLPVVEYPEFISNHACDCLWAYSLFFGIRLSVGYNPKDKHYLMVVLISLCVAIALEAIQLTNLVNGTFDVLDILFEIVSMAVAYIVMTTAERRLKT